MTEELRSSGVRIFEDWTNNSPGFKFNEWEMKGVPLRMEVGPRDIKEEKVVLVRRDSKEKLFISKDSVLENIQELLEDIQENLLRQARNFRDENTHAVQDYTEFKEVIKQGGFVRCGWNGDSKVEAKIKEETKATVRCIPFNENPQGLTWIKTGEEAKHEVIFAKAY